MLTNIWALSWIRPMLESCRQSNIAQQQQQHQKLKRMLYRGTAALEVCWLRQELFYIRQYGSETANLLFKFLLQQQFLLVQKARPNICLKVWAKQCVAGKVTVSNMGEDWRDGRSHFSLIPLLGDQFFDISWRSISKYMNIQGLPGLAALPPSRTGGHQRHARGQCCWELYNGIFYRRGEIFGQLLYMTHSDFWQ